MNQFKLHITEDLVRQYEKLSGDDNPIHSSEEAALEAGYSGKVAHGMLSMALCSAVISSTVGHHWFVSFYRGKFREPIYIGETLQVTVSLETSDHGQRELSILGENKLKKKVFIGKMKLIKDFESQ